MSVQERAVVLADVLYAGEATVLHHYTASEITATALSKWITGTIDMIGNNECDDFKLADMHEAELYVHEIVAVIHSWD